MKIHLMKPNKGFIEDLGDHKDFSVEVENFAFERWLEDREAEDRIGKYVTIMPMANFEQFIQLPLGKNLNGAPVMDRYKEHTDQMLNLYKEHTDQILNLYTVGATHAECSHVMFVKKYS